MGLKVNISEDFYDKKKKTRLVKMDKQLTFLQIKYIVKDNGKIIKRIKSKNVNYAVGYSDSLGIPTSIGATAHDSAEDFKTLAEKLNEGLETPVWQNEADKDYPTLIKEEQE